MKRNIKQCTKCNKNISLSNYNKHFKSCDNKNNIVFRKINNCPYCNLLFDININKGNHIRWCVKNPNRKYVSHKHTHTTIEKIKKSNIGKTRSINFKSILSIKATGRKHSSYTKQKISLKRKKWLLENKDKHNWNYNKNKSIPCEIIKNKLKDLNIQFIEEYIPYNDRFYSIDIAFPDKKIAIEINGNQHYNKDGSLTEYYQNRHNFFVNKEWKIYEFHYTLVFNNYIIQNIDKILNGSIV